MQGSSLRTPPRAAFKVVSDSAPRRRTHRGMFYLIVAFVLFPAGLFLDGFFPRASAAHGILPFVCFAAYVFFARKAVLAWRPDADRLWRRPARFK